jgi:hypothetical protein
MINTSPLPQGCVLRKAQLQDRWYLQKLVWQFEIEEVLELDLRIIGYRLIILLGICLILALQIYLLEFNSTIIVLILAIGITYSSFLIFTAINDLIIIFLNILIGAVFNWSKFRVIEYQQELIG